MSVRVLTGDCRDVLATLPAKHFHTCVTSPPYFGLRDYGVDGQLGLEQTPNEFVAALVAVFREVRRVLRDDGTVWLNLGSSYASSGGERTYGSFDGVTGRADVPSRRVSGGKRASRSRQPERDPAYGIDGTEPRGCSAPDCVYRGRDDEPLGGFQSHHGRNADTGPPVREGDGHPCTTSHDSEHLGSAGASPGASPLGAQASSVPASSGRARAACVPVATASASPLPPPTSSPGSPVSAHTSACTCGIAEISAPSGHRKSGKASSKPACGDPSCDGCGICWAYLAIPLLRFKPKDEINTPHLVAMALQADGWTLRQTICWSKPNPMPESVRDRCTKSHEYLFLLSKGPRYYFDAAAIAEPLESSSIARLSQDVEGQQGSDRVPGKTNGRMKAVYTKSYTGQATKDYERAKAQDPSATKARIVEKIISGEMVTRNRRSVWTVTTQPFSEAHFATFPPALVEPCIKAGCPIGGHVLDPFAGAGTTGLVADRLQRNATLIELNPAYADMARARLVKDGGLFAEVAAE